jgi:CubicO group peptidase (beta-lactamase class C family)
MTLLTSTPVPSQAALTPDQLGARFDTMAATGRLAGLHAVLIQQHGQTLLERYIPGPDDAWGTPLGQVDFGPDTLDDLRSVTKSIVGLLYGIALAAGQVPGPDQPLLAQFPEYPDLAQDPQRARLTIADALTMTLGLEWNEELPYSDPANSEIQMENAPDRLRFILDRPVMGPPGEGWIYGGAGPALLGHLIERGSGQSLPAFADAVLFAPLGITRSAWHQGSDGVASAASGLRLTPRDLARIGQMVAAGGVYDGRPIVPRTWLDASFQPLAMAGDIGRYGYLWYSGDFLFHGRTGYRGAHWVGGFGYGGQRLFVFPDWDVVIVINAGNYDKPDQWRPPLAVIREVFLPSLAA